MASRSQAVFHLLRRIRRPRGFSRRSSYVPGSSRWPCRSRGIPRQGPTNVLSVIGPGLTDEVADIESRC